ncbi:MAG: hypothetical protein ISR89_08695 [Candidatus Marinimicrobia bacterium]|nr:hypothetical protein [Candidatus Neomarinimicrobiota bacterium]MBL7031230.1 hypothetical protein [Candidatus Neomarinimicrobiota bacterium]
MNTKVLSLFTILFLLGCDDPEPIDYSAAAFIEFTVSGGFTGISDKLEINETAFAKLTYGGGYIIRYQLNMDQMDSVKTSFKDAKFFTLKDEYLSSSSLIDAFTYKFSYKTGSHMKTVYIEGYVNLPDELKELLQKLYKTYSLIFVNPDAGTLKITQRFNINKWLFSDHNPLNENFQKKVYFTDSGDSKAIYNYFVKIYRGDLHRGYYWEKDYLYQISFSGAGLSFEENIGNYYFPSKRIPVRPWPEDTLGIVLSAIPEKGLVLEGNLFIQFQNYLKKDGAIRHDNIFIYDELKDGGEVVFVNLINGRLL